MSSENLLVDDLRAPICKQEEDFDQSSFSESHFISTILKKQKWIDFHNCNDLRACQRAPGSALSLWTDPIQFFINYDSRYLRIPSWYKLPPFLFVLLMFGGRTYIGTLWLPFSPLSCSLDIWRTNLILFFGMALFRGSLLISIINSDCFVWIVFIAASIAIVIFDCKASVSLDTSRSYSVISMISQSVYRLCWKLNPSQVFS